MERDEYVFLEQCNNHVDYGVTDQLWNGFIHQGKLLHKDKRFTEEVNCYIITKDLWKKVSLIA